MKMPIYYYKWVSNIECFKNLKNEEFDNKIHERYYNSLQARK